MKVTLKRNASLTNGQLVETNSLNIANTLSSGELLGISENCRTVNIQETPESPIETVDVCEVVIDGACQAILSGSAPAIGGLIYRSGHRVSTTVNGSPIGRLIPRGWSDTTNFTDGETVTVFICGVS